MLQADIPAVGLIINVVGQGAHSGSIIHTAFFDVILPKLIIVRSRRVFIGIQILRQIDDILQGRGVVTGFNGSAELLIIEVVHILNHIGKVIELVQAFIFAQDVIKALHIHIVVRDKPFFIGLAKLVIASDTDSIEDLLNLFRGSGKLHPLPDKITFVVLAQIRDERFKGAIMVMAVFTHLLLPLFCSNSILKFTYLSPVSSSTRIPS